MKLAPICPTPELARLDRYEFHMCLAQQCETDSAYYEHYREVGHTEGQYLILDNGADEFGTAADVSMPWYMSLAAELRADEIVMPDVQQSGEATVAATREAAHWLVHPEGRVAWSNAGCPQIMLVPQGRTISEWYDCYQRLVDMQIFQGPVWPQSHPPTIGIAKNHEFHVEGGIVACLRRVIGSARQHPIHLLGAPPLDALLCAVLVHQEHLRSIDTAKPIVYGLNGQELENGSTPPPFPGRPDDYFQRYPDEDRLPLIEHNLAVFRLWIRDFEYDRPRV